MPMVPEPFAVLEFFAGNGMVSQTCRYAHVSTAQLDINLSKRRTTKAFDLTSPEGLVLLGFKLILTLWILAFLFFFP